MTRSLAVTIAAAGVLVTLNPVARAEDVATNVTDQQITQNVQEKLAKDEPEAADRIIVSTHDGVVTLAGLALAPGDIQTAVHDANGTEGVVRVENRMKVS